MENKTIKLDVVKNEFLRKEEELLHHMYKDGYLEKKDMEDAIQSLQKEVKKVRRVGDLIPILTDRGYKPDEAFNHLFSLFIVK